MDQYQLTSYISTGGSTVINEWFGGLREAWCLPNDYTTFIQSTHSRTTSIHIDCRISSCSSIPRQQGIMRYEPLGILYYETWILFPPAYEDMSLFFSMIKVTCKQRFSWISNLFLASTPINTMLRSLIDNFHHVYWCHPHIAYQAIPKSKVVSNTPNFHSFTHL